MAVRLLVLCLLSLCAAVGVAGRQAAPAEDRRVVALPPDQAMLLVAQQPDSPLAFEDARLLMNMSGVWLKSFGLRNRGTKPIRAYTVAAVGVDEWSWKAADANHLLMPGQAAPRGAEGLEIVPLTDELRARLKLTGPLKGVVALTVVRAEFADGTTFEDKSYEARRDFFWKMFEVMGAAR